MTSSLAVPLMEYFPIMLSTLPAIDTAARVTATEGAAAPAKPSARGLIAPSILCSWVG